MFTIFTLLVDLFTGKVKRMRSTKKHLQSQDNDSDSCSHNNEKDGFSSDSDMEEEEFEMEDQEMLYEPDDTVCFSYSTFVVLKSFVSFSM